MLSQKYYKFMVLFGTKVKIPSGKEGTLTLLLSDDVGG
jgi:hypothetical protein